MEKKFPWFIWMLIQIGFMVLVLVCIFWFLGVIGIPVPSQIQQIFMALALLVAIGIIWMNVAPRIKSGSWGE